MVELPPEFRTTPMAYYVWSRSPRAAHVVAFAIANFVDPVFRWITIRESSGAASEEEAWIRAMLPRERILDPLTEREMGTSPRLSRETYDALIRPNGASSDRIALDHFFLLPQRLQRLFDEPQSGHGPRVVVCANTNRVRDFYPTDPERLRAYTDVFPRTGFSMITTSSPPPYKGRYAFEVVLRMDVDRASEWQDARLVVERGVRTGEFRTGATIPAERLAWYLETGRAVEKALSPPSDP
ncbi:MAG TPA: hypothetical protein VEE83_05095 [Thermoplasmata archaeon]|nr:hypothetical protein [Thermoplasmata archaeon]